SRRPPTLRYTLFPYTTLFRSKGGTRDWKRNAGANALVERQSIRSTLSQPRRVDFNIAVPVLPAGSPAIERLTQMTRACATRYQRSEEHTSELQSPDHLVCRLL